MRLFYTIFFLLFLPFLAGAQTINVSGQCVTGTITLNNIPDINGKSAFQGTGTVAGFAGVTVSVYWLGAPDNLWVLDFDGQPYFQNACNSVLPAMTGSVPCPWDVVTGTTCTGAAPLAITGSGVLPVSLVTFTAREVNKQSVLNWKTASEINNKGFEIQRGKDGINWNSIGFVNGAGNSSIEKSYGFNDVTPLPGKNLYRLIQYDFDGNKSFSPVVSVDIYKAGYYTISNNPGNGVYRLHINGANGAEISVLDLAGRRLIRKTIGAGIQDVDISKYAQGTYLLQIRIANEIFTEKLIKQ
jgi:hypothetical protein